MELKKLSENVQKSMWVVPQLNTYKSAVEELIYNALDAEATCIAIRIHIEKQLLQVIDNGVGITKSDFALLGHRYATSKIVDLSTLKSVLYKYGFRGQSLANIIEVSECVKITSRCENKETFVKTFYNGKEVDICKTLSRPSKGTTVDIKGFLYNLRIQSRNVDTLNEINNIKLFLKQLSLVHNNLSISLKNNSNNVIAFQIHKNRDIYQTLLSLFGVQKNQIQELQVEKNQYKVTAYITECENDCNYNWIFINGQFVSKCKLHKILNRNFYAFCKRKFVSQKKLKLKNSHGADEFMLKNKCPYNYWLFIKCPYYDYDLNKTSKISIVEFKEWDQIEKLLQKLVKFYTGDCKLTEISYSSNVPIKACNNNNDVRDEIKKVMDRILGNNHKKIAVSQSHNGIKGKLIRRKNKKRLHLKNKNNLLNKPQGGDPNMSCLETDNKINRPKSKTSKKVHYKCNKESIKKVHKPTNNKVQLDLSLLSNANSQQGSKCLTHIINPNFNDATMKNNVKEKNIIKSPIQSKLPLVIRFEKDTGTIKNKCNILAKRVDELLSKRNKRKRDIFVNQSVEYSNIIRNNKNMTIRKRVGEVVIHDYNLPLPPKINKINNRDFEKEKRTYVSTYDLVKTVLDTELVHNIPDNSISMYNKSYEPYIIASEKSAHLDNFHITPVFHVDKDQNVAVHKTISNDFDHNPQESKLTFESHNYHCTNNNIEMMKTLPKSKLHFISKRSRDNFILHHHNTIKKYNNFNTNMSKAYNYAMNIQSSDVNTDVHHSHYTIEYFESNNENAYKNYIPDTFQNFKERASNQDSINSKQKTNIKIGNTYTIISSQALDNDDPNFGNVKNREIANSYFSLNSFNIHNPMEIDNTSQNENVSRFVDKTNETLNTINVALQSDAEKTIENNIEPINVCETVFNSTDIFDDDDAEMNNTEKKDENINNNQININMEMSHYFENEIEIRNTNNENHCDIITFSNNKPLNSTKNNDKIVLSSQKENICTDDNVATEIHNNNENLNDFQFKNRFRFLPKGMSQIFENYNSKTTCHFDIDQEYYNKNLYNKFATNVHEKTKIFEPNIQNVKEFTTEHINKVNAKLNKDNASLIFNAQSLKHAELLGQVDEKFIAATLLYNTNQHEGAAKLLVLFDQHAVHERIRLEENLSGYFNGIEWKSVTLNDITMTLTKDELLYLHNYKEKLYQLGLRWTILNNNNISIDAIPEAILGKNSRQVEIITKAVKKLIAEEIHTIKSQGGCIDIYPKTLMDLIFSEACRYAIKFGDKLQKSNCIQLLNSLSDCKNPFQCAHGRPVMAVLFEVNKGIHEYKVNFDKIKKFKQKLEGNIC